MDNLPTPKRLRVRQVYLWQHRGYAAQIVYRNLASMSPLLLAVIVAMVPCALFWMLYDLADMLTYDPVRVWIMDLVGNTDAPDFYGTFATSLAFLFTRNVHPKMFPFLSMNRVQRYRVFYYELTYRSAGRKADYLLPLEHAVFFTALHATFSLMRGQWWLYRSLAVVNLDYSDDPMAQLVVLATRLTQGAIFWSAIAVTVAYAILARNFIVYLSKLNVGPIVVSVFTLTCVILPVFHV